VTNEEAKMVTAQVLEATHTVDDRVREVENKVLDVDNKVAGVDDKVAGIDDKVALVIDGTQSPLVCQQKNIFNCNVPRGKRDQGSHATSGRRHGSSETLVTFFVDIVVQAKASAQGINYDRTFAGGSLPRIPLLTTTLPVVPIASKQLSGFSKEVSSTNGNPMGHFCGSTENVRSPDLSRPDGR